MSVSQYVWLREGDGKEGQKGGWEVDREEGQEGRKDGKEKGNKQSKRPGVMKVRKRGRLLGRRFRNGGR